MSTIKNKVVIITGASSGIDEETAKEKLGKVAALFANAVLYAFSQPDSVNVSDLVIRSGKEA